QRKETDVQDLADQLRRDIVLALQCPEQARQDDIEPDQHARQKRHIPYGQKIGTAEEPVFHRAIALAGGAELGRWEASWLPRLRRLPRSPNRSAHGPGLNLGRRSRRLLMVIAQEPTQSLPALNRLRLAAGMRITREQQDVTLALVIPLDMI